LRATVRRAGTADLATVETEHIRIDLAARKVWRDDDEVRLTPTEWGLLNALVTRAGRRVAQQQLLHEVWGPAYHKETNYLLSATLENEADPTLENEATGSSSSSLPCLVF
jgi:two-component system KDP operon response regulator KdpE